MNDAAPFQLIKVQEMMITNNYESMSEEEILDDLLRRYEDDEDAVNLVIRTKKELPYLRNKKQGQTARQHIIALVEHLKTWY